MLTRPCLSGTVSSAEEKKMRWTPRAWASVAGEAAIASLFASKASAVYSCRQSS